MKPVHAHNTCSLFLLILSRLEGNDQGLVVQNIVSLSFLHSERPKLHTILAFLSATGLRKSLVKDPIAVLYFAEKLLRTFAHNFSAKKKSIFVYHMFEILTLTYDVISFEQPDPGTSTITYHTLLQTQTGKKKNKKSQFPKQTTPPPPKKKNQNNRNKQKPKTSTLSQETAQGYCK